MHYFKQFKYKKGSADFGDLEPGKLRFWERSSATILFNGKGNERRVFQNSKFHDLFQGNEQKFITTKSNGNFSQEFKPPPQPTPNIKPDFHKVLQKKGITALS